MPKTILFAGGGSVGHVAPAVAVWRALEVDHSDWQAHFVCGNRSDETEFLKAEELTFTTFKAPKLGLSYPFKLITAVAQAKRIITELRPDLVFSKGGYLSVPLAIAAHKKGIPIVLHESDSVTGRANRLVAKLATKVCTGYPTQKVGAIHTGNPIRPEVNKGSKEAGLKFTGLEDKPTLLVLGGSQGSQALNEAVLNHLAELLEHCQVVHLTGRGKLMTGNLPGYFATEFVTEELPDLYACADLALSRAGAGSIAELGANNIATILVPLRGVGHNHQAKNARVIADAKAGVYLEQTSLDKNLIKSVVELLSDSSKRTRLSQNLQKLNPNDASGQIAKIVTQVLA